MAHKLATQGWGLTGAADHLLATFGWPLAEAVALVYAIFGGAHVVGRQQTSGPKPVFGGGHVIQAVLRKTGSDRDGL